MKNLIKYLGIFAVAASFGLQTMTVNAATTCPEGKTLHRNYYMFLSDDGVSYLKEGIDGVAGSNKYFTLWNGANKYINYPNLTPAGQGIVRIYNNSGQTVEKSDVEWNVVEFWQKFYTGFDNMAANTYHYDTKDGKETYLFHEEWLEYEADFQNGQSKYHATDTAINALKSYLKDHISNIGSSDLVTKGTIVPDTSYVVVPTNMNNSNGFALWKLSRVFKNTTLPEGTNLDGKSSYKRLYSPGAYYIDYCVDDKTPVTPPDPEQPAKEKTITYDKNTTDTVNKMPENKTFKEECTNISSSYPERKDYQFLGWSTNKNASVPDTKYAPGSKYCGDSITLYAIWKKIETNPDGTYTVTYHGSQNGVQNLPGKQSANKGSCLNISNQKPTLYKNNFLGWSTVEGAQTPDSNYAPGAQYCGERGNLDLYAVWQTQTGIGTHFIVFAGAALVAGIALVVAKKKDLFKQI